MRRISIPLFLLISIVLVLLAPRLQRAKTPAEFTEQRIWSAYWTVASGYTSILEMKNNRAKETLTIYPKLYFSSGEEYPLAAVTLGPRQTTVIRLNEVLAALPHRGQDRKEGTLEVRFMAPNDHAVMGSVSVTNPSLSTAWNFRLYAADPILPAATLRGLFWFYNEDTRGFVALQNTSEEFITVSPQFDIGGQKHVIPSLHLAPGRGVLLDLREELRKAGLDKERMGGMEIAYQGPGDGLQAHEVLFDKAGFSTEVDFLPNQSMDMRHEWALRTPQFAIGQADARLGLSVEARFAPTVVLHNFAAGEIRATLTVGFRTEAGAAEKQFPVTLSAGETRSVALGPLLEHAAPASAHWASLEIAYSSRENAIAADLVSITADGHHSIRSVLNWVEGSASDGPFWQVGEGRDTLLGVYNADTQPAQVAVSLDYYVGGERHQHHLAKVTIPPRATEQMDIAAIIASHEADAEGDVIPAGVTSGGYLVKKKGPRLDHVLITEELVLNREAKSYLTFYNTCCPLTNIFANPFSLLGGPGDGLQIDINATNVCSGAAEIVTDSGTFSSQNSGVATVGANNGVNNGKVSMMAVGKTAVNWQINFFKFAHFSPPCIAASSGGPDPITVNPVITSISPGKGVVGATIAGVTITGKGLSGATVNAGTGITATVKSTNATTIVVDLAVASNATAGNNSISVSVSGQTSHSVNFFVQVPTSLSIVPGTDSTTTEAPCTTGGGLAGCGVTRTFQYQVNDQGGQPITVANMALGDVLCNTSTNQLNLQGYRTTCGGMTGSCGGTAGPCGKFTDSNGQFPETLTVCAPACKPSGTCTTAGQTIANQTWTIAGHGLTSDVKSISYQCNKILVNGR